MARANAEKAAVWREAVDQWHATEMSAAAFCRSRELPVHQFHYWRKRLASATDADDAGAPRNDGRFVRVDGGDDSGGGVTLIAGAYRIALSEDFCEATLRRALAVLGGAAGR